MEVSYALHPMHCGQTPLRPQGEMREIKSAIIQAQSRVAANANAEMLSLYFSIGRSVAHKTQTEKWGTGIIDAISRQLQKEMPGLRGFSARNIRNMRQFYEKWAEDLIWQTPSAKLESEFKEPEVLPQASANHDLPTVVRILARRPAGFTCRSPPPSARAPSPQASRRCPPRPGAAGTARCSTCAR